MPSSECSFLPEVPFFRLFQEAFTEQILNFWKVCLFFELITGDIRGGLFCLSNWIKIYHKGIICSPNKYHSFHDFPGAIFGYRTDTDFPGNLFSNIIEQIGKFRKVPPSKHKLQQ